MLVEYRLSGKVCTFAHGGLRSVVTTKVTIMSWT